MDKEVGGKGVGVRGDEGVGDKGGWYWGCI